MISPKKPVSPEMVTAAFAKALSMGFTASRFFFAYREAYQLSNMTMPDDIRAVVDAGAALHEALTRYAHKELS